MCGFFCLWYFKAVASMPIENEKKNENTNQEYQQKPLDCWPIHAERNCFFRSIDWCRCLWLELIQLDRGLLWFVRSAYFVLIFFFFSFSAYWNLGHGNYAFKSFCYDTDWCNTIYLYCLLVWNSMILWFKNLPYESGAKSITCKQYADVSATNWKLTYNSLMIYW